MIEPFSFLTLLAIIIIIGYVGSWIFEKTRIPDVIWLLIFGLLAGPIFGMVDPSLFVDLTSLMVALALMIILFDAGLNMNIYQFIKGFPRSTLLAILNIFFAMVLVGYISVVAFGLELIKGLALGAAIGGTSATIVLTIIKGLKLGQDVRTLLSLESILTDPICIVLAITLLKIISPPQLPLSLAVNEIFSEFSIAFLWGLVAGIIWMFILDYIKGRPFDYMLTLAIVFLTYVIVESIGGNGSVAALAFGLALGNSTAISKMLKLKKRFVFNRKMIKRFHSEITFFIRSFFFVFMGLVMIIDVNFIFWGVLITLALIISRIFAVQFATLKMKIDPKKLNIIRIMAPRGEGAAVLSQLPRVYAIPGAEIFSNIAFITILVSVIYTSIFTRITGK
jgi:cell volume regulation protein A